jgi:hypothetical protein
MGGDYRYIVVSIIGGDSCKQSLALRMPQISQACHGTTVTWSPDMSDQWVERPHIA